MAQVLSGDVSFHSGWTFHQAGANNTDKPREVFTIIFMVRMHLWNCCNFICCPQTMPLKKREVKESEVIIDFLQPHFIIIFAQKGAWSALAQLTLK